MVVRNEGRKIRLLRPNREGCEKCNSGPPAGIEPSQGSQARGTKLTTYKLRLLPLLLNQHQHFIYVQIKRRKCNTQSY